jgi:DNA-binding transcriptional LysR family regulator
VGAADRLKHAERLDDLLRQLAVLEEGVALLPNWFVSAETVRGMLTRVLPDYEGHKVSLYLLLRRDARPRVRAVADFLFAELSGSSGIRL